MNILDIIIIGIVEGITEFLPISSTAHIDITRHFLSIPLSDFIKSFEIFIQLGAICAVIVLYGIRVLKSWKYVRNIVIAFIPTGIIGFLLYKLIKAFLLGNTILASIMLVFGGIIIVVFERRHKSSDPEGIVQAEELSTKQLLLLGVAQSLAVVPGVSRSGAVIIAGRLLKLPKVLITEFSFTLAVPTMLAASAYDLLKTGPSFSTADWWNMFYGFIVSFIVALVVVRWLIGYIKKHSFEVFGWYRIMAGIAIFAILAFW